MKKWLLLFGTLFLVCILIYVVRTAISNKMSKDETYVGMSTEEYEAYCLREKYPTEIILFGEEMQFEYEVPVRVEERITAEALAISKGYLHAVIVINDYSGDLTIADSDYMQVWDLINSDARYSFIYIGSKRVEHLVNMWSQDGDVENECALVYTQDKNSTSKNISLARAVGVMKGFDEEDIATEVVSVFAYFIERFHEK